MPPESATTHKPGGAGEGQNIAIFQRPPDVNGLSDGRPTDVRRTSFLVIRRTDEQIHKSIFVLLSIRSSTKIFLRVFFSASSVFTRPSIDSIDASIDRFVEYAAIAKTFEENFANIS